MQAAAKYEEMYNAAVIEAINADESKYQTMWTFNVAQTWGSFSMGSAWNIDHDYDAASGNI